MVTHKETTTLGQASIIHENGAYYVIDQYDFNDATAEQNDKTKWQIFKSFGKDFMKAGLNPYQHARNIGSHYGSKPGEGIKVKIKIIL